MSKDDQKDQSQVVGEMFDPANVVIPDSQITQPQSHNNGFTADDIQQSHVKPEPTEENEG